MIAQKWHLPVLVLWMAYSFPLGAQTLNSFRQIVELTPREQVRDVLKDEIGFIWIATDQGLHKFDGIRSTFYPTQLGSSFTKDLQLRANGRILVAHDFGLTEIESYADTVIFHPLMVGGKALPDTLGYPKSILEDRKGVLWIGENSSIIRIDGGSARRIRMSEKAIFGDYRRSFALAEDAFGEIWAISYLGNFYRWNRQIDDFEEVPLPVSLRNCSAMTVLSGDNLIIGAEEGLLSLKVNSDRQIAAWSLSEEVKRVSSLAVIGESEVYAGTWDRGLYFAQGRQPDVLRWERTADVSFDDVVNLFAHQDRELWIVGVEQIGYRYRSAFNVLAGGELSRTESLTTDGHEAIYISKGSTIDLIDKDGRRQTVFEPGGGLYAAAIHWSDNRLWLGSATGLVGFYDSESSTYTSIVEEAAESKIHSIQEDRNGGIWFTGREDGLLKVSPDLRQERYPEVVNSVALFEAEDGSIWCGGGGENYLMRLAPGERVFRAYPLEVDFYTNSSFRINAFAIDERGQLWIGTSLGLLKISDIRSPVAVREKLQRMAIDEEVKALNIDGNGQLWASTNLGLVCYRAGQTVIYDKSDGLPSNILRERELLTQGDQIFVATVKGTGVARLDPQPQYQTPMPVFTGVQLNGRRVTPRDGRLPEFSSNSEMKIEFLSLDYPGNDVYYQYRVLGIDKMWTEPDLNRSLSFYGFKPGEYTLEVRAQRSSGHLWSPSNQMIFTVMSPWFRTWWAYTLFAFSLVAVCVVGVTIYTDNLKRNNRKLERLVKQRTREISEKQEEIVHQKNEIIRQKQEIIDKNQSVFEAQQALAKAELNYQQLRQKQLEEELEFRNKQLATHTLKLIQKNESFTTLKAELEKLAKGKNGANADIKKGLKIIDESFRLERDWEEFQLYFEQIYTGFYAKLKINYPALTNQELRHCALIRLNMSISECASLLGISPDSVKVSRARLKKKLELSTNQSVLDFILAL